MRLIQFLLLMTVLLSTYVYADKKGEHDHKKINMLIKQAIRPSIEEYLQALGGKLPAKNPVVIDADDFKTWENVKDQADKAADLIVILGKYFDDYTFFPMGRDSYRVSDYVEAFWLTMGINDKVKRVNGSGPTIKDSYEDEGGNQKVLADYMTQIGWSSKYPSNKVSIIFDNSMSGSYSQSAYVANAIASRIHAKNSSLGGKNVSKRIAMVGTNGDSDELKIKEKTSITNFDQSKGLDLVMAKQQYNIKFLGVGNQVADLMYDEGQIAWNGSFSAFKVAKSGKLLETPGYAFDNNYRRYVLYKYYEILKYMASAKYVNHLKKRATAYGISVSKILQAGKPLAETQKELNEIVKKEFELLGQKNISRGEITGFINMVVFSINKLSESATYKNKKATELLKYTLAFKESKKINVGELMEAVNSIYELDNTQLTSIIDWLQSENNMKLLPRYVVQKLERGDSMALFDDVLSALNMDELEMLENIGPKYFEKLNFDTFIEKYKDHPRVKMIEDDLISRNLLTKLILQEQLSVVMGIDRDAHVIILNDKQSSENQLYLSKLYRKALINYRQIFNKGESSIVDISNGKTLSNALVNYQNRYGRLSQTVIVINNTSNAKNGIDFEAWLRKSIAESIPNEMKNTKVAHFEVVATDNNIERKVDLSYDAKEYLRGTLFTPETIYELDAPKALSILDKFVYKNMFKKFQGKKNYLDKSFLVSPPPLLPAITANQFRMKYFTGLRKEITQENKEAVVGDFSVNANLIRDKILSALNHMNSDLALQVGLVEILKYNEKKFLRGRDVRRLIGEILFHVKNEKEFLPFIEFLLNKSVYLQKVWSRKDYFEDVQRSNHQKTVDVYKYISSQIEYIATGSFYCGHLVFRKVAI